MEFSDKELDLGQVVASLYDPAAEAAAREKESEESEASAAEVPADGESKSEEAAE